MTLPAKYEHSLEQLVEVGVSVEFICTNSLTPVEDEVLKAEQFIYLYFCLDKLGAEEQQIIYGIFFSKKRQKGS